jgi:hypothetical protein
MPSRSITLLGLALVLLGAWVLRVRGLDCQLPQWTHSDGYVLRNQAAHLRGEMSAEDVRESVGYYPKLPIAAVAYLPEVAPRLEGLDPLERALALARAPWTHIRRVSVWLSLGAVAVAYALARRFMGPGPALLAAALTATSLLHVTYSAAQRPHGMLSSVTSLAVLALLHARSRAGLSSQLAGALGVAASLATLQSGFAVLPAWLVAWWRRRERASVRVELVAAALSLALVALVTAWAYEPFFAGAGGAGGGGESAGADLALAGRHAIDWSDGLGRGALVLGRAFALYEPVIALGVLAALLALAWPALRRRVALDAAMREDLWVCLGFVLPYAGFFALFGRTLDRFAMPLIPFAAVAAAWGFQAWGRALLSERRRVTGAALAAVLLALPTLACWRLGTLRSRPDTLELAAQWIAERSDPGRRKVVLAALNLELPFFYSERALETLDHAGMADWTRFQRSMDADAFSEERFDVERERNLLDAPADGAAPEWNPDFVVLHTSGVRARDERFSAELKRWRERGAQSIVISPFEESPDSLRRESGVREQSRPVQMYGIAEEPTLPLLFASQRLGPRLRILWREPAAATPPR